MTVPQFAYNEISFFLVRLLQRFESMEMDDAAQPPNARPPAVWQNSPRMRTRVEKIKPRQHLTLFVEVRGCSVASDVSC